jgi:hypothetical protein
MLVLNSAVVLNWGSPGQQPSIHVPQGARLLAAFGDFTGDLRVAYAGDAVAPLALMHLRVCFDGDFLNPEELEGIEHLSSFFHPHQNKTFHVFYWPE